MSKLYSCAQSCVYMEAFTKKFLKRGTYSYKDCTLLENRYHLLSFGGCIPDFSAFKIEMTKISEI